MENISNNPISNKSYEIHNPLQIVSSARQTLENIEKVQNNNTSSLQCADLNTLLITKYQQMASKEQESLEQLQLSRELNEQLTDLHSKEHQENINKFNKRTDCNTKKVCNNAVANDISIWKY